MNYATNIALIDRASNVVTDIIWGMIYEGSFETETQYAVIYNDLAVSVGDSFDGENFYHEGEKVLSLSEMLSAALMELADADEALHALGVEWEEEVNE